MEREVCIPVLRPYDNRSHRLLPLGSVTYIHVAFCYLRSLPIQHTKPVKLSVTTDPARNNLEEHLEPT
jgi:hypothetical protein